MLRMPAYIQLEVTDMCNLRCKHCYHFNTEEMPKSKDLADDQMLRLVERLIESRIYSLTLTGGEPLMRFELLAEIVKMANKGGLYVSVNSNLQLLTVRMIKRLIAAGLNSFLVSCPASDEAVYRQITRCGSYKRFSQKLQLLIAYEIPVMVNMVVSQDNFRLVRKTAQDLFALGVKRFSATPVALNVEHPDTSSLLTEQQTLGLLEDLRWCFDELGLKVDMLVPLPKCFLPEWCWDEKYGFTKRACQAGRMSAIVSNVGDVRPCPHNPLKYGNLLTDSLRDIWENMALYRKEENGIIPDLCVHCPILSKCNGSCRTNSLALTGCLDQPERFTRGHIQKPVINRKRQDNFPFSDQTILTFASNLRWRQEYDGGYSVASGVSYTNLLIVNEELFRFINWLEKSLPLTIREVVIQCCPNPVQRDALMSVLKTLVQRKFIRLGGS